METSAAFASNDTAMFAKANTNPPASSARNLAISPSVTLETYTEIPLEPNDLLQDDNAYLTDQYLCYDRLRRLKYQG